MISPHARTRLGWLGCALAMAAGVFTAVAVSGVAQQRGGEVTVEGDSESITVKGSEIRNVVTVERNSGSDTITIDAGSFNEQHPSCEEPQPGEVECDAGSIEVIEALMRDGDDTLQFLGGGFQDMTISLITGEGDDKLFSKNGSQLLKGGKGEDNLQAGNGDDELLGGPQRDVMHGGHGEDTCDETPQDGRVTGCEN